ncbi:MAG: hypothetical protein MJZ75_07215 [Paludibacteraceae bacterium]|nr:hypothetical protein [Paludibacteraceae bacterium]
MKKIFLFGTLAAMMMVAVGCDKETEIKEVIVSNDGTHITPIPVNDPPIVSKEAKYGIRYMVEGATETPASYGAAIPGYAGYQKGEWRPYCSAYATRIQMGMLLTSLNEKDSVKLPTVLPVNESNFVLSGLGEHMFAGFEDNCSFLAIPSSVVVIETAALEDNAKALSGLVLQDGTAPVYCFGASDKLGSFSHNLGLQYAYIGRNMEIAPDAEFGPFAKAEYKDLKVVFGPNVTSIPANCFANTKGILSITMLCDAAPQVGKNAFEGIEKVQLLVKPGTENQYTDGVWKEYFKVEVIK